MITFPYPVRHFLRITLQALRDGNDLTIYVRPGWRSNLVAKEFPFLPSCAAEAYAVQASGKKPPLFKMSILMLPIITVHNFVLSGAYRMELCNKNGVRILYFRHSEEQKKITSVKG